tara:strand:- start:14 stop:397 length:384 start_codon:yes stop_codon:yes gene_type:complete
MRNVKISSNRNFGLVFFTVFLIISLYPILNGKELRYWSLGLSLIFLLLGIINSSFLTPLNKAWFKFGLLLGKIISPVILGLIFFLLVTPIGILMRILKKDILSLQKNDSNSYWIEKPDQKSRMKKQY